MLTIYPKGKVIRPVGGQVYSMFLYYSYKSSQGPQHERGPESFEIDAEGVWLDRVSD